MDILNQLIDEQKAWLEAKGQIIERSGDLREDRFRLYLHTDYGPPDQDKGPDNQDYIVAWCPSSEAVSPLLSFSLAIADGLTDSFRSEWAAQLACWAALRTLAENRATLSPREVAERAFNAAGAKIGQLADELAQDPQDSLPEGFYLPTWKYMLQHGKLLQTTLMLVWFELPQNRFYLALIGDGGAVCRQEQARRNPQFQDYVVAQCNLDTYEVQAIGPANQSPTQWDLWFPGQCTPLFLGAFYTDGIARGLSQDQVSILDQVTPLLNAANPASGYIEQVLQDRPQDFADNLTLAVVEIL